MMLKDNIMVGTLEDIFNPSEKRGGYVQINNLLVEVKCSDDGQGYIVDIFNNDNEDLLATFPILKDDLGSDEDEY